MINNTIRCSLFFCAGLFLLIGNTFAANFYWVGGSGNWTDLSHWVTVSGGAVNHTQVPTANDNIIFDSLSFTANGQTVTLNSGFFRCRNMNWSTAAYIPVIAGSVNDTLEIYGSLTLKNGMTNNFLGDLLFYSFTAQDSIQSNGVLVKGNLILKGTGTYQLKSNLTVQKNIYLQSGHLKTNNFDISGQRFVATSISSRTLTLGSSTFILTGSGLTWDAGTSGFVLSSGTSKLLFNYNGTQKVEFNSGGSAITYNVVEFDCDSAVFSTGSSFDSLKFNPGLLLVLPGAKIQNVSMLIANGQCGSPIMLKSSNSTAATINITGSNAVVCNYLRLSLIAKSGTPALTANNSIIEVPPCANWIVNPPVSALTYYWVGGTGNWHDTLHWSLSSGGAAANCIPGTDDNVIFNSSSGFTAGNVVTINNSAYCKNMTWSGALPNPTLGGSNFTLHVKGNMVLIPALNLSFSGNILFNGTVNQNITSAGVSFNSVLQIEKSNGELQLIDNIVSLKSISLVEGTFNTMGKSLSAATIVCSGNGLKTLNISNSTLSLTGSGTVWDMESTVALNASGSLINCTHPASALVTFKGGNLTYNNLVFNSRYNALAGSNNFSLLSVPSGASLTLQSGSTQTTDSLRCSGTCSAPVTLECSSVYATPATISKTGFNTVNLSFVTIRNVIASNAAPVRVYNALNSYGLYNTTGWTITNPGTTGRKMYWIGGTGNWSSPVHWSLTSGGLPTTCIPTQFDTVYFNAASFNGAGQTVTVDVDAYCRYMDWTGALFNPKLLMVRHIIIRKKAVLNNLMQVRRLNKTAQMMFLPQGDRIDFDSKKTLIDCDILFEGQNSTDTLRFMNHVYQSDTTIFNVKRGTLLTNGDSLNTGLFICDETFAKTIHLGSSFLNLAYSWNVTAGSNLLLNAGTSTIFLNGFYPLNYFNGNALSYNNVKIKADRTVINGNNTYGDFTILPGVVAEFAAGSTHTVNGNFNAIGNCTDSITIRSTSTSPAVINKSSGTVNCEALNLKNISRTGGAVFNTIFSSNLGSVTGWNFDNTPPVVPGFNSTPGVCVGDSVYFNNTSTAYLNGAMSYLWDFGDGTTSSLTNPVHFYPLAGNRVVKLTTTLNSNQCYRTYTDTIQINAPFISLTCSDNDQIICEGSDIEFQATGLAGAQFQFLIDGVPTGPFSAIDTFATTSLSNGQTVTANVLLNGCQGSSAQSYQFTVQPSPVVTLSNSAPGDSICAGSAVTFTASGADQFRFFINGIAQGPFGFNNSFTTSTLLNNQVVSVTGKDTASGCTRQGTPLDTMHVIPYPLPVMTCSAPSVICEGTLVHFNAAGALLYEFFVNGVSVGPATPGNIYSTDTLHQGDVVSLKGTNYGCTATSVNQFTFIVNPIPQVVLSDNMPGDTICAGQPVVFTASGATTYQFFINGIAQGSPSGSATFTTSALSNGQTVNVQGTTAGCSSFSAPVTVTVNNIPVISLTSSDPDNIVCSFQPVTFTASGASSYSFFVDGISQGSPSTNNSLILDSLINGQTIYAVGYSSYGCSSVNSNSFNITVLPLPMVNLYCSDPDTTICEGQSITFTALGALQYEFFVDGLSQGAPSGNNTLFMNSLSPGISQITVEGTGSNGCVGSGLSVYNVLVHSSPVLSLTCSDADLTICDGTPVTFYANGASQYQFFVNGSSQGSSGTVDSLLMVYPVNGQVISISGSQYGCAAAASPSLSIIVNPVPVVQISSSDIDHIICEGTAVDFLATGANAYFYFLNGDTIGILPGPAVYSSDSLQHNDTIFVQGLSSSGCISQMSDTLIFSVNQLPVVALQCSDPDTSICTGDAVIFTASGASVYQLYINGNLFGSPVTSGLFNLSTLDDVDQVSVLGAAINGCQSAATDTFTFNVNPAPVIILTSSDADNTFCFGDTVIFSAGGALSYEFFVDGFSQGTLSATDSLVLYTLQNFQTVSVMGYNNGCPSPAPVSITNNVYAYPNVNLISSAAGPVICAGDPITFTATGATINEFFIDGVSQGLPATVNSFTTSGLQTGQIVTVEGTNVVCPTVAPQSFSYNVINYPVVNVVSNDPDNEICYGQPVVLTANGASSYQLFINHIAYGLQATNNTFTLNNIENGDLIEVKGFNAVCGIFSADSFAFTVHKMNLEVLATPSWQVCEGEPITLTGSGADQYQFFHNGVSLGAMSGNPTVSILSPVHNDQILMTGYSTLSGCQQSSGIPFYIYVGHEVQITAQPSSTFCEGDSVWLSTIDSSFFQWYHDSVPISGANASGYFATTPGTYQLFNIHGGDGMVWSVGSNFQGQLGDSTFINSLDPVLARGLKQVKNIAAGDEFNIAVNDSGKVYTWGNNQFGALGDGTFTDRAVPYENPAITNAVDVAAGAEHAIVLLNSGNLVSFGKNTDGQLGIGNNGSNNFPQPVPAFAVVTAVQAGGYHTLIIATDSTLWSCGDNLYGQLGDSTNTDRNTPVHIEGLNRIIRIACGRFHNLALDADSNVWVWGNNASGQLGMGSVNFSNFPLKMPNVKSIVDIAAGDNHSLLLKYDGSILSAGHNNHGQLGNGSTISQITFGKIDSVDHVSAVFSGSHSSYAIRSDQSVWVWGLNSNGQLGTQTITNVLTPQRVVPLTGASVVAAGMDHAAFLMKNSISCGSNAIMLNMLNSPPVNIYDHSTYLSTDSGNTYQWYYNGSPVINGNQRELTILGTGTYFVQVTYANGCMATSPVFNLFVGLEDKKEHQCLLLYPNPSDDYIVCVITDHEMVGELKLFDYAGRSISDVGRIQNIGESRYMVSLEGLSAGLYSLQVVSDKNVIYRSRFTKIH